MFTKIISEKGFLFPVLALAGLLTVAPPVFSQTQRMEGRQESAVRSKKAVQKPRKPGKRAGSQGTAVKGGRKPGMLNRPAGKKVETPSTGAGKPSRDCDPASGGGRSLFEAIKLSCRGD